MCTYFVLGFKQVRGIRVFFLFENASPNCSNFVPVPFLGSHKKVNLTPILHFNIYLPEILQYSNPGRSLYSK